jgi:predicted transcriptional regulator of viral defense system
LFGSHLLPQFGYHLRRIEGLKKMRLTLHTDYALRVLIHVAIADGKLITISDIAESFDISKQHLMKVVSDLSKKGYLDTVRGSWWRHPPASSAA